MAVSILDAWATVSNSNTLPQTLAAISSGTDRLRVVGYTWESTVQISVSAMSLGGQSATALYVAEWQPSNWSGIALAVWDDAAIGAMSDTSLTMTRAATPGTVAYSYATYQGVNQTTPVSSSSTQQDASSNTLDLTTSSGADDVVIAAISRSSGNRDITSWDTLTQVFQYNTGATLGIAAGTGGDATTTVTGDGTSGDFVGYAIVLNGGAGGASGVVPQASVISRFFRCS